MRVLMFGWEFPPHISGGLGTASYGLTKGMASMDDMEVIFVVPKAWGDEDQNVVRLIGANKVPVVFKQIYFKGSRRPLEKIDENTWRCTGGYPTYHFDGSAVEYDKEGNIIIRHKPHNSDVNPER